jgi:hypothetical protein
MMMPPVTIVVMTMMVVVPVARFGKVGLSTPPVADLLLSLPVESVSVRQIIARPVSFMRLPVAGGKNIALGCAALMQGAGWS